MKTFKELAIRETLDEMQVNHTNLLDNPFRLGSMMYFEIINEARRLAKEQRYRLTEIDGMILETDLGEYDVFEGNLVPLDCPMQEINEEEDKPIGKPKKGGPKKFYVYVKDGDTVKKVSFGDTTGLSIKRDDPARRRSFRARHNCDNPGPKTKARYWSCYQWRAGAKVDN